LRIRADCLEMLETYPHHRAVRLRAARASVYLTDYQQAIDIVAPEYDQIPDPQYASSLGRIYLAWFDARLRNSQPPSDVDLELLESASRYIPWSRELAERVRRLRQPDQPLDDTLRERFNTLAQRVASSQG